jgi:hypothetical protein
MILARNKNGQIGRKTRSMGEAAVVSLPTQAAHTANVILDPNTLDKNQKYWNDRELAFKKNLEIAAHKANVISAQKKAELKKLEKQALKMQKQTVINPLENALKIQFALQAKSPQSARVVESLKADFYDRELVPVPAERIPTGVRSPDFAIYHVRGNPLTRDGEFGVVTDFDKIVSGQELDNTNVQLVGGTMVRKLPSTRPAHSQMGSLKAHNSNKQMGWEWTDVGNWFTDVGSQTADQLATQLPKELANQLNQQLFPPNVNPQTGQVTVYQPVQAPTSYVNSAAQSMNVPPAVIYGAMGLMGVGVLLVLVKSLK